MSLLIKREPLAKMFSLVVVYDEEPIRFQMGSQSIWPSYKSEILTSESNVVSTREEGPGYQMGCQENHRKCYIGECRYLMNSSPISKVIETS